MKYYFYKCSKSYDSLSIQAMKLIFTGLIAVVFAFSACRKDSNPESPINSQSEIPEFYANQNKNSAVVFIAGQESKLNAPQDLDFNTNPNRPDELWVINKDIVATGGSTVMFSNVAKPNQSYEWRRDGNAWHFMNTPSAISFSKENHNWATSHDILDANHAGGTFTGPSLWSSDLSVYAINHGQGTNGSHLDMLHGSPYSMGIESDKDNAFWIFDGYNEEIVYYDFKDDHGPGMHDHSDGVIRRYSDVKVKRLPGIPSHIVLDKDRKWLYVVDGGNNRVFRMDVNSAKFKSFLPLRNELLAEHTEYTGAITEVLLDSKDNLDKPCGIELVENRLFVSEYESGNILCYDLQKQKVIDIFKTGAKGLMGIKYNKAEKRLYFVNALANSVNKIEPLQ